MSIIRVKNNKGKKNEKQVGVELPLPVYSYLTVYALTKGVTRTVILKEIIAEWAAKVQELNPNLINDFARRLINQWKIKKATTGISIEKFRYETGEWLKEKGIEEEFINKILKEINDGKN